MMKPKTPRAAAPRPARPAGGAAAAALAPWGAAARRGGGRAAFVAITTGARLETYVIPGERGSGVIGINGAAAHLVHPGDLVILISYGQFDEVEIAAYDPRVVFVDADNRVVEVGDDPGHAPAGSGLTSGSVTRMRSA